MKRRGDPAHALPLRPRRRRRADGARHRRARLLPRSSRCRARRTSWPACRGPASARSSPTTPTRRVEGGEKLHAGGLRDRRARSRPATARATSTYSIPAEQAIFSGDVLFQGSIGRTDLPGGDHADAAAVDRELLDTLPDETARAARPHGRRRRSAPSAPTQPVPARARRRERRIQAPRGTFDVLGDDALARERARRATARRDPRARRLRRGSRRPTFEATQLFAARRGGVHRRRAEGDVHVRGRRRRSR